MESSIRPKTRSSDQPRHRRAPAAEDRGVLIVDPVEAFREGLAACLTDNGFEARASGTVPVPLVNETVVILGVRRQRDWGSLERLVTQRAAVIAVLGSWDAGDIRRALDAGAISAASRVAPLELLTDVVKAAVRGAVCLPREVLVDLANGTRRDLETCAKEWLKALAAGATVAELARSQGFSEREMYRRLRRAYAQLGASDRSGALVKAAQEGLI